MAKLRRDAHGLYVIAGGYLWRPVFPSGYDHALSNGTVFSEGAEVRVHHSAGTPLAWVGNGELRERWFAHGMPAGGSRPAKARRCGGRGRAVSDLPARGPSHSPKVWLMASGRRLDDRRPLPL